jgi:hypothetical protein
VEFRRIARADAEHGDSELLDNCTEDRCHSFRRLVCRSEEWCGYSCDVSAQGYSLRGVHTSAYAAAGD